jgi:4-hydroxy-tetrahydrodipicolinate reductase
MKIALIGYGKMGRQIHEIARSRNYPIVCIVDEDNNNEINSDSFREAEVAFEFTRPESAVSNFIESFKQGVPVVSGTTGWLDKWDYVREQCMQNEGSLFYASNFSLGVNLFFNLNKKLAEILEPFSEYRAHIEEIHHINKLDAPSGTAISLANQIIENNKNWSKWKLNPYGEKDSLPVFSIREGSVTGTHSVSYVSEIDKITIRHEAFSRKGFAIGAMTAAEFLIGKKGVFGMEDLLAQ